MKGPWVVRYCRRQRTVFLTLKSWKWIGPKMPVLGEATDEARARDVVRAFVPGWGPDGSGFSWAGTYRGYYEYHGLIQRVRGKA